MSCENEPDVWPAAVRQGRSFAVVRRSSVYASSPSRFARVTPGTIVSASCCEAIQRAVVLERSSFCDSHSRCGELEPHMTGEPSGIHACEMSRVTGS